MICRTNLYKDPDGNFVKGKYLYHDKQKNKYNAHMKYPEGYSKSGVFYTFDDAKFWIESHWDVYKSGWYWDGDTMVLLKVKGQH